MSEIIVIEVQQPVAPKQIDITVDAKANAQLETLQNNVTKVVTFRNVFGDIDLDYVVGRLNATTTVVSSTDSPVLISLNSIPLLVNDYTLSTSKKHTFIFRPGKGTYGVNGTPVTKAMLYQLPVLNLVVEDIPFDKTTPLGELLPEDFLEVVNSIARDVTDPEEEYYFSYTTGTKLTISLFKGTPGTYGGDSVFQFVATDFATVTTSEILPAITHTSSLINNGADGSSPYATRAEVAATSRDRQLRKVIVATAPNLQDDALIGATKINGIVSSYGVNLEALPFNSTTGVITGYAVVAGEIHLIHYTK